MMALIGYLNKLELKRPNTHKAIILTNQELAPHLKKLYYKDPVYYFDDQNLETMRYCPREHCWRGTQKHTLHGCYLFIDDISNMLAATDWASVPSWLRKLLIKGRKFGVHIVATLIDPFDLVIQVRRTVDVAYKFQNIWKTRDPDETLPPLKWVFGWYRKRRVSGSVLWREGDKPEQAIRLQLLERKRLVQSLKKEKNDWAIVNDNSWHGKIHYFNRSGNIPVLWRIPFIRRWSHCSSTEVYDTLQDISPDDDQKNKKTDGPKE